MEALESLKYHFGLYTAYQKKKKSIMYIPNKVIFGYDIISVN